MNRRAAILIAASAIMADGMISAAQFDIRLCNPSVPPQFRRIDIKFVASFKLSVSPDGHRLTVAGVQPDYIKKEDVEACVRSWWLGAQESERIWDVKMQWEPGGWSRMELSSGADYIVIRPPGTVDP